MSSDFYADYATALHRYVASGNEQDLARGHELGRRALDDEVSMLVLIEKHFQLADELARQPGFIRASARAFLLQTLAPLNTASRGFLDGTKRYEEQRARADDLADRDEFRNAVVNSLQEGFFVSDRSATIVEVNDSFTKFTGYSAHGLPYRWPYPWLVDEKAAWQHTSRLAEETQVQYESPIRHRDGRLVWIATNINRVDSDAAADDVYVGTIRDITAERAFAARESAVLRLATAVSVATSLSDVLSITLDECRLALDVHRVVSAVWPTGGGDPTIQVAGQQSPSQWRHLDAALRDIFEQARRQLPLTVQTVQNADAPGQSNGTVAVLTGSGDVALWLELRVPRRVSAEDRLLITVLVGHLGLAIQHVRQFEAARDTSLTLQHAMLAHTELPAGFAVRYEPATPPLEVGGDWYDVLPVGEHRIGIIVGDCVGRGLSAAAVMGQLRSSARALLLTGAEPAKLLEDLDSVAELIPDAFCTTVFLAILDTETGEFCYSCAGHLPAVLAMPNSAPVLITDARSTPLAVQHKASRPQSSVILPPGSTLMLYTDGLVERRDVTLDDGMAQLADVVTAGTNLDVDGVADLALRDMSPPDGYRDDIAIVVYRRPYPRLVIDQIAAAEQLSDIRHELAGWMRAATISEDRIADIVLAVNEACANSVEHGYRDSGSGRVRVDGENDGARIYLRVTDEGVWKPGDDGPGVRGRGLLLMRMVSDSIEVQTTEAGTVVEMSFDLSA